MITVRVAAAVAAVSQSVWLPIELVLIAGPTGWRRHNFSPISLREGENKLERFPQVGLMFGNKAEACSPFDAFKDQRPSLFLAAVGDDGKTFSGVGLKTRALQSESPPLSRRDERGALFLF
jgi:hypothetical protein